MEGFVKKERKNRGKVRQVVHRVDLVPFCALQLAKGEVPSWSLCLGKDSPLGSRGSIEALDEREVQGVEKKRTRCSFPIRSLAILPDHTDPVQR